jgi:hypothetical protein
MLSFLSSIYVNYMEPIMTVFALVVLYVIFVCFCIYWSFKFALFLLTAIRDWWHDGRK